MERFTTATGPLEASSSVALIRSSHDLTLEQDGHCFPLKANDIGVVDRARVIRCSGGSGWSAELFDFGNRRVLLDLDSDRRLTTFALEQGSVLCTSVNAIWQLVVGIDGIGLHDAETVHLQLLEVVNTLLKQVVAEAVEARASYATAIVRRAQLLVEQNLSRGDFAVTDLAELMDISPRQLSAAFAAIGTTTSRYIADARMRRARSMVMDPANRHRQVASIARACGFDDQSYFTRQFRAAHGITPLKMRKANRGL